MTYDRMFIRSSHHRLRTSGAQAREYLFIGFAIRLAAIGALAVLFGVVSLAQRALDPAAAIAIAIGGAIATGFAVRTIARLTRPRPPQGEARGHPLELEPSRV